MTDRLHYYLADHDGWRVLVTPWPMLQNAEGLVQLSVEQLALPPYDAIALDVEHFFRTAGPNAAVCLYDTRNRVSGHGPDMVGSFWLRGPLSGLGKEAAP
jgi:hypothetical protein